jgi:hypothetical protein
MKLILSLTSSVLWQELFPKINLTRIETVTSVKTQSDELVLLSSMQNICDDEIVELLESMEKAVVFYQQAEYFVGEAIAEGSQISDVIEKWANQIVSLLNLKKKNRHKIRLINLNQFVNQPEANKILSEVLGTEVTIQNISNRIETKPYHLLLAKQAVQQADLIKLNTLLFASSEVAGDAPIIHFDIQNLINEERSSSSESHRDQNQSILLAKELVDAHDKIHSLSQQIENTNKTLVTVRNSKNIMQTSHTNLMVEHESANKVLQNEMQSLLKELDQNADSSARLNSTNNELKNKITSLEKDLSEEQLCVKEQHKKLHSFRIKNRKFQAEILTLNEFLENQIEKTRELAEQKRELQSQSVANQKKLQRELKKAVDELIMFKSKNAEYTHKLYSLESEMRVIKDSAVWKTSAPLRAFSNILTKHERNKQSFQRDLALIMFSQYFDAKWYLETYTDVAEANLNPAEHYLKFGVAERRYCSLIFDPIWYLDKYPDVAESGLNPLLHYIKYGELEGRQTSPKLLEFNGPKK